MEDENEGGSEGVAPYNTKGAQLLCMERTVPDDMGTAVRIKEYLENGSMVAGIQKAGTIHKKYMIWFLIIWVAQMAAAFYFCTQKQGFHEDEYYTYYSTARTAGFYVEDGQWMDRETYRNEFVVLPGERFQYGLVKRVQSWDVHPPMYYWVFHTVASLAPNVFSKWIGLSVNLFFYGINIILLTYLSYLVSGRDVRLSLLVTLAYGFSPAALSGVVFIRMYEMLTAFVLLCGILHMQAVERGGKKLPLIRSLVPMMAVTYIGFLTQYYYFIFLFFLAIAFCLWLLWRDRNVWNCLRYGISQAAAFGLAYLTYPSFPAQMFRGQRGAQATENFFDVSNTLDRIRFFLDLLDRYVFGHQLYLLLLVIVLLAVTAWRQSRRNVVTAVQERGRIVTEKMQYDAGQQEGMREAGRTTGRNAGSRQNSRQFGVEFYMLMFTAAGYFLAVSKTALLLGETSNRYQLPVYGIIVLLVFMAVKSLWRKAAAVPAIENGGKKAHSCIDGKAKAGGRVASSLIPWAAAIFCLVMPVTGHVQESVVFLYPEDREQTAYARACVSEHTPAVYLYRPGEEWCIWDVTNELLEYPAVYFASAEHAAEIEDETICKADAVVLYMPKGEKPAGRLEGTDGGGATWAEAACELIFEEKYCDVYYVRK